MIRCNTARAGRPAWRLRGDRTALCQRRDKGFGQTRAKVADHAGGKPLSGDNGHSGRLPRQAGRQIACVDPVSGPPVVSRMPWALAAGMILILPSDSTDTGPAPLDRKAGNADCGKARKCRHAGCVALDRSLAHGIKAGQTAAPMPMPYWLSVRLTRSTPASRAGPGQAKQPFGNTERRQSRPARPLRLPAPGRETASAHRGGRVPAVLAARQGSPKLPFCRPAPRPGCVPRLSG